MSPLSLIRPSLIRLLDPYGVTSRIVLIAALFPIASIEAQDPFDANPFGSDPLGAAANPFGMDNAGQNAAADSPFGGFVQPGAVQPNAADSSALLAEKDPDPVVRMLHDSPPKSPEEMANGLTWMVRIKRWDEVRRLLDLVAAANWSIDEYAKLARAAGSSLWIRMRVDEAELTEAQSELVGKILAAPAQLARDPARVDEWIDQLASPQAGERRLAQLRLQDGGLVAIERLVERLLNAQGDVEPGLLAATVVGFGRDGVDALRAACLVGDPDRAARVYLALAELPGNQFSVELGSGLASQFLDAEDRAALAEVLLRKYGTLPGVDAIHAYLKAKFDAELAEYQQARAKEAPTFDFVWRQTPDQRSIQSVEAQTKDRRLERVAQLAALRMQLEKRSVADAVEAGVVILQRAYQSNPQLELGELHTHLIAKFPEDERIEASYWMQVFDRASDWQMHGAAIRSLQMLMESSSGNYVVPIDFLSRLLRDSRPVIRYEALENIAEIDPGTDFAGAEQALATAMEMTKLSGGPHALVIGLQAEFRQVAQQQLQLLTGADVTSVNSARAALTALDGVKPIEMIVVVDRVADQSLYELLQRLRNSKRGSALPIAVMTDELYQHERRLIAQTPGMVVSLLSRDPEQMQRVVGRLVDTLDTAPLTASDREHFGMVAGRFLARIASARDKYAFYPLSDWRDQLSDLVQGLSTKSQTVLLAGLGTAESQRQLADMAANGGLTAAERLEAARAFGRSVRRFGMNLGRDDVLRTYALYNTLGPDDPASATSIGLALDVVEAHAGKAAWPEGL